MDSAVPGGLKGSFGLSRSSRPAARELLAADVASGLPDATRRFGAKGFSLSNRKDHLVCPLSCSGRSIRSRLDAFWLGVVDRRSSSRGWRPQLAAAPALRRDAVVDCGRNGTALRDPASPGRPKPSAKTSKVIVRSSISDASAVFVFLVSLGGFAESQSEALCLELHPALLGFTRPGRGSFPAAGSPRDSRPLSSLRETRLRSL